MIAISGKPPMAAKVRLLVKRPDRRRGVGKSASADWQKGDGRKAYGRAVVASEKAPPTHRVGREHEGELPETCGQQGVGMDKEQHPARRYRRPGIHLPAPAPGAFDHPHRLANEGHGVIAAAAIDDNQLAVGLTLQTVKGCARTHCSFKVGMMTEMANAHNRP